MHARTHERKHARVVFLACADNHQWIWATHAHEKRRRCLCVCVFVVTRAEAVRAHVVGICGQPNMGHDRAIACVRWLCPLLCFVPATFLMMMMMMVYRTTDDGGLQTRRRRRRRRQRLWSATPLRRVVVSMRFGGRVHRSCPPHSSADDSGDAVVLMILMLLCYVGTECWRRNNSRKIFTRRFSRLFWFRFSACVSPFFVFCVCVCWDDGISFIWRADVSFWWV